MIFVKLIFGIIGTILGLLLVLNAAKLVWMGVTDADINITTWWQVTRQWWGVIWQGIVNFFTANKNR